MIRNLLGIHFEDALITGNRFESTIVDGPDRKGPPTEERRKSTTQDIATLIFGNKSAVFDFTEDLYFSWIRTKRILVRGEKGEIMNDQVNYLKDYLHPVSMKLVRSNAGENGNLEGHYLKGYLAGEEWCYVNPYIPGTLSDEEIAIATCLTKMAAYVAGGPSFYSLAEASQDHYLSMMMQKAIQSKVPVQTSKQVWANVW